MLVRRSFNEGGMLVLMAVMFVIMMLVRRSLGAGGITALSIVVVMHVKNYCGAEGEKDVR